MKSIDDRVFTTTLIETNLGSGTGFFYGHKFDDKYHIFLITNKHIIDHCTNIEASNINITRQNIYKNKDYDLAVIDLNNIWPQFSPKNHKFISSENIGVIDYSKRHSIFDVVMIGYPNSLYCSKNLLPILRRGTIAFPPVLDYNNKKEGLVDIAVFPGSSGSPIFEYNPSGNRLVYKEGLSKFQQEIAGIIDDFIGINYAGFTIDVSGNVMKTTNELSNGIKTQHKQFINLSLYIKASVIKDFVSECYSSLPIWTACNFPPLEAVKPS